MTALLCWTLYAVVFLAVPVLAALAACVLLESASADDGDVE